MLDGVISHVVVPTPDVAAASLDMSLARQPRSERARKSRSTQSCRHGLEIPSGLVAKWIHELILALYDLLAAMRVVAQGRVQPRTAVFMDGIEEQIVDKLCGDEEQGVGVDGEENKISADVVETLCGTLSCGTAHRTIPGGVSGCICPTVTCCVLPQPSPAV